MNNRQEIYDRICNALTEYEDGTYSDKEAVDIFYNILIEVSTKWEDVITADET